MRETITALALCNNVTPFYPDEHDKSRVEFQASSPDEVALVKFAESLKMRLVERDQARIQLINPAGKEEHYEILANFPFSSETKRMGILVRHLQSGTIFFYLKGAEVVMQAKIAPNQRSIVDESCETLAL